MATVSELDARVAQPDAGGIRNRANRHEAVRALDGAAVFEFDKHTLVRASHRSGARFRHDVHAELREFALDHRCRIGVFSGQDLLAARHERDL